MEFLRAPTIILAICLFVLLHIATAITRGIVSKLITYANILLHVYALVPMIYFALTIEQAVLIYMFSLFCYTLIGSIMYSLRKKFPGAFPLAAEGHDEASPTENNRENACAEVMNTPYVHLYEPVRIDESELNATDMPDAAVQNTYDATEDSANAPADVVCEVVSEEPPLGNYDTGSADDADVLPERDDAPGATVSTDDNKATGGYYSYFRTLGMPSSFFTSFGFEKQENINQTDKADRDDNGGEDK